MDKLRIHTRLTSGYRNSQHYYRQMLPMRILAQARLAHTNVLDPADLQNPLLAQSLAASADIFLMWQELKYDVIALAQHLRDQPKMDKATLVQAIGGLWAWDGIPVPDEHWPASVVLDIDDDLFSVDPTNPAFGAYGIKLRGRLLTPGACLRVKTDEGEDRVLFEDGKNGFSVQENRARVDLWRDTLRAADLVTCTTERLKATILKEAPDANVFVFPNCVAFHDYPSYQRPFVDDGYIRILFQGGATHYGHINRFRKPIENIVQRYPKAKFVIFGGLNLPWMLNLPNDQLQLIQWVPAPAFRESLSLISPDINLAFLDDTTFNNSRSCIKWYEGTAIQRPAAGLMPRVAPYIDEIQDGQTALLYGTPEEFEERLSKLIESQELRTELAWNARTWQEVNRDPMEWCTKLLGAYTELREKRKQHVEPINAVDQQRSEQSPPSGGGDLGVDGVAGPGDVGDPGSPEALG